MTLDIKKCNNNKNLYYLIVGGLSKIEFIEFDLLNITIKSLFLQKIKSPCRKIKVSNDLQYCVQLDDNLCTIYYRKT